MGIVDHHDGAVLLRQHGQLVHRPDVAVHREHAVGDHQLAAGLVGHLLQQFLAVRRVFVPEHLDLGSRKARAVDDAGVVQLIGEDEVVFPQNGAHGAGVGRKTALEDHARLHILEARDLLLEVHVDAHGPGDGPHRARTHAELPRGRKGRFDQLGMVGQAQVIVAGQVDDLLAVVVADGGLLVVENAQLEMRALGAQFVHGGGQVGKLRAGSGLGHGGKPQM